MRNVPTASSERDLDVEQAVGQGGTPRRPGASSTAKALHADVCGVAESVQLWFATCSLDSSSSRSLISRERSDGIAVIATRPPSDPLELSKSGASNEDDVRLRAPMGWAAARETAINPGKTRRYAPFGPGFVRHGIGGTGYESAHVPGVRRGRAGRRSTTPKAGRMNDLRREPECHAERGTAVAIGLAAARAVARSIYATPGDAPPDSRTR
jgi:hypothetical protein